MSTKFCDKQLEKPTISDTDFSSLASKNFEYVLKSVKESNLNFQIQLSPYSAFISLKKSFAKDKDGQPVVGASVCNTEAKTTLIEKNRLLQDELQSWKDSFSELSRKFESLEKESALSRNKKEGQHACPKDKTIEELRNVIEIKEMEKCFLDLELGEAKLKDETIEELRRDIEIKEMEKSHLALELSEAKECLKSCSETSVEYANRVKFLENSLTSMERGHDLVLDEMKSSHAVTIKGLQKKLDAKEKANVKLRKKADKVKITSRSAESQTLDWDTIYSQSTAIDNTTPTADIKNLERGKEIPKKPGMEAVDQYNTATGKTTFCMDNLEGASLLDEGMTCQGETCRKNTGNSNLEHASLLDEGIVGQGIASPTQPAVFKEDKNLDCTNTLPNVATDAFIEGASNESISGSEDADKWPAWRVGVKRVLSGRYECLICLNTPEIKINITFATEESLVSHLMERHANPAEWMEKMESC